MLDTAIVNLKEANQLYRIIEGWTIVHETTKSYHTHLLVRKIKILEEQPMKWYLPHFAVVKTNQATTKTHVVFDACFG